ncbi:reverse transcriptase domain-containing protein [Tanacetum coccineum]
MKQNRVSDDALCLYLFPYSLTHHATAWFDCLLKNYIHTFQEMASKFLSKYFPPSIVMKLRNDINMFFNGLTLRHHDTINATAGGTFMKRRPEECYDLIENMTAHHNDWDISAHRNQGQNYNQNIPQLTDPSTDEMLRNFMISSEAMFNSLATSMIEIKKSLQERPQGALPSNTIPNPQEELKAITTQSGIALARPSEKLQDKSDIQVHKFLQMLKKLHFNISLAGALALMPKYVKMLKDLFSGKEKLLGLANTSLTENCLAVLLKKLPEKLRDPGKFLIPYDFPELKKCMVLADLGANINLMPLSIWKKLMRPKLIPTRMTLELANRSVAYPAGIAEDVCVQVGKFAFPTDFIVVDYDVDPRVSLILGRPFLRTACALVDVYGEELILRDDDEKLIFHADRTLKHPHENGNYTTSPSDSSPSLIPFETNSSPTTDIDIIDPILERFTDEPTLVYSSPSGDDDDDLFYFKSDNEEWKMLLYRNPFNNTHSEKDKNKDSKAKSLIDEANVLLPQLLDCDSALHEEFPEIDTLPSFPSENEDKVFNPCILIYGSTHFVTNKVTQDKNLKDKTSSKALLILEDSNFLRLSSDRELLFHLELSMTETLLSFSSENKDKVFNPGILISKGVHSFTLGLSHRTYETFKIVNVHPNILNESSMKIFPFFCFCPKDKGIRGESS